MNPDSFRFDRFVLSPGNRQLRRDDVVLEVNARYLDALALMVREPGQLITKERFIAEVWRGVPVTDEALTQCIKSLRRLLGDNAANPRFIETVVKHGYRFIAPVEVVGDAETLIAPLPVSAWPPIIRLGLAGTAGAGLAGLTGGLLYGFAAASQPVAAGMGSVSVLLVVICLTVLMALIGGAGVSFGIAVVTTAAGRTSPWIIGGGAAGGALVGALVKLVGLDAFTLLFGQSPGHITGAPEGALLGAAVGLGVWLHHRAMRHSILIAAAITAITGALIPLLGGHLMAGSLALLAQQFPASRLRLDQIWSLFGESHFGLTSQIVTGGLEGALFGGFIVAAMRYFSKSS